MLRSEGETEAARTAYSAVRKGFARDGRHYYAALVSLEESALALDEGEHFDALAMAQEASVLLVRGAAEQEALAVLRVLLTALERGAADKALVLTVVHRLPGLKPRPAEAPARPSGRPTPYWGTTQPFIGQDVVSTVVK